MRATLLWSVQFKDELGIKRIYFVQCRLTDRYTHRGRPVTLASLQTLNSVELPLG